MVKTSASSVPIQSAISRSSSRWSEIVPFRKREPVSAGAEPLERVARGVLHALVARQPEVVVRPEHDALGALHLDDRARRALEHAEVGHQVVIARSLKLLEPLVVACLVE